MSVISYPNYPVLKVFVVVYRNLFLNKLILLLKDFGKEPLHHSFVATCGLVCNVDLSKYIAAIWHGTLHVHNMSVIRVF